MKIAIYAGMAIQKTNIHNNHSCERKETEDSEPDTCESGILMLSGLRSSEISLQNSQYGDGSISPAWDQRLGYIRALMFLVV